MTTKTNLFATAKVAPATKPAKADHEIVVVPELSDSIKSLSETRNRIKTDTASAGLLEEGIKSIAQKKYLELYRRDNRNPKSFLIAGDPKSEFKFLVQVQDKYLKVTEEREADLVAAYGDDIITENRKYVFNPELLEKHMETISDLIMNSKKISADDKAALIVMERTVSVKKGVIDTAATRSDMDKFILDIQPIMMLSDRSSS